MKTLNRLSQVEAERFVKILEVWTVSAEDSPSIDLSLKKKGWLTGGHTLMCTYGKDSVTQQVFEPAKESFKKEKDGVYRPVFLLEGGVFSGKWVLKS